MTATTAAIEAAFEAANEAFNIASANLKRSKSRRNVEAYMAAAMAHDAAATASRHHQDRLERAATVARRLALVAPRRALRARQLCLEFA